MFNSEIEFKKRLLEPQMKKLSDFLKKIRSLKIMLYDTIF